MEVDEKDALLDKTMDHGTADLTHPFVMANFALIMTNFIFGLTSSISDAPILFYIYDVLDLSASYYYAYSIALNIVECLQIVLILVVTCIPIMDMKRYKIFWGVGIVFYSAGYLFLAVSSSITYGNLIIYGLLSQLGYYLANGMLILEVTKRTRMESTQKKGYLVVTVAGVYYIGAFLGYIFDEVFYADLLSAWNVSVPQLSVQDICWVMAVVPIVTILPTLWVYEENESGSLELWTMVRQLVTSLASFDVLLAFLAIEVRSFLELSNGAESEILLDGCDITSDAYIVFKVIEIGLETLGVWVYRNYFFDKDFLTVFVTVIIIMRICEVNQIWLIYDNGHNAIFDSPDMCMAFYGTLECIKEFVNASKTQVKAVIMYLITVSKPERTGMFMVLFSSIDASFDLLSDCISDEMLEIWPTSAAAIEEGDYTGWWHLQLIAYCAPLPFIILASFALPRTRQEQVKLSTAVAQKSTPSSLYTIMVSEYGPYATASLVAWLISVIFVSWWTWWTEMNTYELDIFNTSSPSYGTRLFIFLFLTISYSLAVLLSLAMGLGYVDWMKKAPPMAHAVLNDRLGF